MSLLFESPLSFSCSFLILELHLCVCASILSTWDCPAVLRTLRSCVPFPPALRLSSLSYLVAMLCAPLAALIPWRARCRRLSLPARRTPPPPVWGQSMCRWNHRRRLLRWREEGTAHALGVYQTKLKLFSMLPVERFTPPPLRVATPAALHPVSPPPRALPQPP